MAQREHQYRWSFELLSSPEALWPLISNTDRFNRDAGLPSLRRSGTKGPGVPNAGRRLFLRKYGMTVEWEEEPFEWVRPSKFGVRRVYLKGPVAEMRVLVEMSPRSNGGTLLTYEVTIRPRNLVGRATIPIQIGLLSARAFAKTIARYDRIAQAGKPLSFQPEAVRPQGIREQRLSHVADQLTEDGVDPQIVSRLVTLVETADDMSLARIRPFELAEYYELPRTAILDACLRATRRGMLDLQWDVICPHCRGAKQSTASLSALETAVSCESCNLDFTAAFDRTVELTFRPNPSLRKIREESFCMGGPGLTPHIVAQQLLKSGESRTLTLPLEPGRYRLRGPQIPGETWIDVGDTDTESPNLLAGPNGWSTSENAIRSNAPFRLENRTDKTQLFILERTAWSDQAATAAEVTALQVFRDLFSTEALRPGEQISVGTLTMVFTDLRGSTQLYKTIGDAPAFGRVMNHFDLLKEIIGREGGALVKTIGDAVMAVFRQPEDAVRAMLAAQKELAHSRASDAPLILKVGIHTGPCIAVTLNERLDYFGGTVNMAARLEALSTGGDIVISDAVKSDPDVQALLSSAPEELNAESFQVPLKGFDNETFDLWRVSRRRETAAAGG
jgi:class 3 adenylate cyclase